MIRTAIIVTTTLALAAALPASPANAQNVRSFVSSQGSDSNNCSFSSPCRHFSAALAATVAGGEIAVLDTADYGDVSIDKAISIVNEGEAAITPQQNAVAITVNAGPNDAVSLRGLTIDGAGQDVTVGIISTAENR